MDGEGCFHVAVRKNENLKLGWEVMPGFTIVLHNKDKPLLVGIQKSLQVDGKIYRQGPDKLQLQVHSIKELVPPSPPSGGGGGEGDLRGPGGDPPAGVCIYSFWEIWIVDAEEIWL